MGANQAFDTPARRSKALKNIRHPARIGASFFFPTVVSR